MKQETDGGPVYPYLSGQFQYSGITIRGLYASEANAAWIRVLTAQIKDGDQLSELDIHRIAHDAARAAIISADALIKAYDS